MVSEGMEREEGGKRREEEAPGKEDMEETEEEDSGGRYHTLSNTRLFAHVVGDLPGVIQHDCGEVFTGFGEITHR